MSSPPLPATRPPTACVVCAYGNNAVLACPCGATVIARSSGGSFACSCGRSYAGHPQPGGRVQQVVVGDPAGAYALDVDSALHQSEPR